MTNTKKQHRYGMGIESGVGNTNAISYDLFMRLMKHENVFIIGLVSIIIIENSPKLLKIIQSIRK